MSHKRSTRRKKPCRNVRVLKPCRCEARGLTTHHDLCPVAFAAYARYRALSDPLPIGPGWLKARQEYLAAISLK